MPTHAEGLSIVNNSGPDKEASGMESSMAALLGRMDRLIGAVERSSTQISQRRYVSYDFANPAPIGLFAFAIATALYMTGQAHITETSTQFIAFSFGMFMGGAVMVITGFLELFRQNGLGATAFCIYGSFWISVGVYGTIKAAGIFFLDSPKGEEALLGLMAIASLVFCLVTIVINKVLPFLFLNLTIMFALLSAGVNHTTLARIAGWWGLWASLLAVYVGAAVLFRDMWAGKEILPQGWTKAFLDYEQVILPRAQVHADVHEDDVEAARVRRRV